MKIYDPFKKQLQQYEAALDKEKLWANTAHAIPRKRRRIGIVWLWMAGGLLVGAGLFMLPSDRKGTSSGSIVESISTPKTNKPEPSNEINLSQDLQQNENKTALTDESSLATSNIKNSPSTLNTELHQANMKVSARIKTAESENSNTSDDSGIIPQAMSTGITTAALHTTIVEAIQDEDIVMSFLNGEAMDVTGFGTAEQQRVYIPGIGVIPLGQIEVNQSNPRANSLQNNQIVSAKHSMPIELFMTQSYGISSLMVHAASEELQHREQLLNNQIESLENLSTRVGARFYLSDRWIVGSGLQWNQLTTKTNFSWIEEERLTGEGIAEVVIDPDGTQNFQTGEVGITRQTQWQAQRYSTHTTFNVEAQIAYQLVRHVRLGIMAGVHGTYNLFYEAQGSAFDAHDQPIRFVPEDLRYKLTSPLNFGLFITGTYQFNRHWGMLLELQADRLHYREYLNQTPITYKHNVFALGIGLRYVL